MFRFIKILFPSYTEWNKLKYETYKHLLLSVLGLLGLAISLLYDRTRGWLFDKAIDFYFWVLAPHSIHGYFLLALSISLTYSVYRIIRFAFFIKYPFLSKFREGKYDNILWRWGWKNKYVILKSMKPHCLSCDTELLISEKHNGYGAIYTEIYCTMCNSFFMINNLENIYDHVRRKIESDARTGRWKNQ